MLYLVGVPIGNYEDITLRAINTLKEVDVIACEDTRTAKKLLDHFDIRNKKLIAHHEHNEEASAAGIMNLLAEGNKIAFISDSGMPAISDPGFVLIKAAAKNLVPVKIIPGVSASVTALAASGISPAKFHFEGFLPRKSGNRKKRLTSLLHNEDTLIFYEAPHRILETLTDMNEVLGERKAALCRELTKEYEEITRGTFLEIYNDFASREKILGEMVLVVEGGKKEEVSENDIDAQIKVLLLEGKSPKDVRDIIANEFGLKKSEVYSKVLSLK